MALTDKLTAIGDAIRDKTGSTDLLTLDAMPTAISGITTGGGELPEEAFIITGTCSYRFANNGWNWFLDGYGDKITTSNIEDASYMFFNSDITEIPFDINFKSNSNVAINNMFMLCSSLKHIPYVKGRIGNINGIFSSCSNLIEIPEDWADFIDWSYFATNAYSNSSKVFDGCHSLRRIPQNLLNRIASNKANTAAARHFYSSAFNYCYCLDEIITPVVEPTVTSNMFLSTFDDTCRIKNITFTLQEDGTPQVAKWKTQTINLNTYIGYGLDVYDFTGYSSGITKDKLVKDDATYQVLKDDPDWFTLKVEYSRYNHDSAVATINSLPDTSAYLATAGGTNTIKFRGGAGSLTDGGAINTLTEEEIAVATAKGWTVTLS